MTTMDKLPPGPRALGGRRRRDQQLRHDARARAAAVLHATGSIDSMEGLYFESSATTVVPLHHGERARAEHPSNPVRGLVYGTSRATDFDARRASTCRCSACATSCCARRRREAMAADQPDLKLVATVPDLDGQPPNGWKIYEVAVPGNESPLVTGLDARAGRRERARAATTRSAGASRGPTRPRRCRSSDRGSARPRRGS